MYLLGDFYTHITDSMALKLKKFEKMVRGNPIGKQESYEKETVEHIKLTELEHLQQHIFVNSFNHIDDDVLREKCSDISAHYRLFKDDETHYTAPELSNDEKNKFKSCINNCINIECATIINEKECISTGMPYYNGLKIFQQSRISHPSYKPFVNKIYYIV